MSAPLIIDSFAGGGGASTGIEMALGRSPDYAINHSADALAMHEVNHPETVHLDSNIWDVSPREVTQGRPVGLFWASPDCKHFSKAKGGKPLDRNIRDLAWVVVRWAEEVSPDVIILENVEEFVTWGPLYEDGKPIVELRGQTFEDWTRRLKRAGYKVQWRELRACDYGAPTIRKRFFMIARRDGKPIVWPKRTHGDPKKPEDARLIRAGRLKPYRTAAEIIDWSLPCPSIFDTSEEIMRLYGIRAVRPLAEATMRRIARGVVRYVLEAKRPFIVGLAHGYSGGRREYDADEPITTIHAGGNNHAVVVPSFVGCGGRAGQSLPRGGDEPTGTLTAKADGCVVAAHLTKFQTGSTGSELDDPTPTLTGGVNPGRAADEPLATLTQAGAQQAVVAAHMMRQFGTSVGHAMDEPTHTDTATVNKSALITPFLATYYGNGIGQEADGPLRTDTTKDRFGLVTVEIDGITFAIADIGMRMLTPRERFRAQGFPDSYIIDRRPDGSPLSATVQGSCCGNSVCPPLAEALVAANCGHLAVRREAAE